MRRPGLRFPAQEEPSPVSGERRSTYRMTMERGAPRLTTLALAGVLVLLAGCSNDGGGDGSSGASASAGSTASTGPTGPQPAEIEATIEVGADPIGIASGEGSLWVVNADINAKRGSVSRIDPATNEVLATIDVGSVPLEVAVGEGSVWVSNSGDDTLSRINPSSNETVAGIDVCAAPEGVAVADGSVWVVCEDDGVVAQHRPRDRRDGRPGRRRAPAEVRDVRVRRHLGLELLRRDDHADRPRQRQGPRRDHDRAGTADHGRGRGPPLGFVHRYRHRQRDRSRRPNEVVATVETP